MGKLRTGSKTVLPNEVKILPMVETEIKMVKSNNEEWNWGWKRLFFNHKYILL